MDDMAYGVDRHRLKLFRQRKGLSARGLAALAGIPPGRVRQIEEGLVPPSAGVDVVQKLTEALGVGLEAILYAKDPIWHDVDWSNRAEIYEYYQELENAKDVLTCTQRLEGYLTQGAADDALERQRMVRLGWSETEIADRLASDSIYIQEQIKLRRRGYVHRIICGEKIFQEMFRIDLGWSDTCLNNLKLYDATLLCIVSSSNWHALEVHVSKLLPSYRKWDKILVADNTLAMFRPNAELFLFTRHGPTILKLRQGLEKAAALAPYSFPTEQELCMGSIATTVHWSQRRIKEIARRVESACGERPSKG